MYIEEVIVDVLLIILKIAATFLVALFSFKRTQKTGKIALWPIVAVALVLLLIDLARGAIYDMVYYAFFNS